MHSIYELDDKQGSHHPVYCATQCIKQAESTFRYIFCGTGSDGCEGVDHAFSQRDEAIVCLWSD